MSIPKPDGLLSVVLNNDILPSPSSQPLIDQDQHDEETSDCPLLTPSPPPGSGPEGPAGFKGHGDSSEQTLNNFNREDGLGFLHIVNSSCKPLHDEPSSRDPMVETSSNSGSSSDTNEPVCTQLLTQLNTAYTHLAPDAQALFYNQDNGGKPPLTGIQLVVPKPPKNYTFMNWNWPFIRKSCFWSLMSFFIGCFALAIGVIVTMPKRCDPVVEWWQGSLFYEIFPASFDDAYKNDGIGDFRGITNRLDYIENLGVKGIRLNSIFLSKQYPLHYMDIESLTEIDPTLGDLTDFSNMVIAIHQKRMYLILDLPLYPFIKSLDAQTDNRNATASLIRQTRDEFSVASSFPSHHKSADILLQASNRGEVNINTAQTMLNDVSVNPFDNTIVKKAIRFWSHMGVDGFYLKGLEHFTKDTHFVNMLSHYKADLGAKQILMCSETALKTAEQNGKNAIMNTMNLIDVTLRVANGTKNIRTQVSKILKGALYQKTKYPWVHWSTGSVDTSRLASAIKVPNATVAIAMMGMMLPGTPSIFYGDEIGMLNSDSKDHRDMAHLYHLVPMRWDNQNSNSRTFSSAVSWMPESARPAATNLTGLISIMSKLRSETMPIYIKAVRKNEEITANGGVRYTIDELIVIERWFPRRHTYVFVSNLGIHTQTKDLSSLYYRGYVVVGPEHKVNRQIYFKELTIPPGEAFIIKLDK